MLRTSTLATVCIIVCLATVCNSIKILFPAPSYGFDPSEASISWLVLTGKGVEVSFATPDGQPAQGDHRMLTGDGLGIWKDLLMARQDAVDAYNQMSQDPAFVNPMKWTDAKEEDFDGLLLPGGHDKGMREYLESSVLQQLVVSFFKAGKPVAAICHGVVLAA